MKNLLMLFAVTAFWGCMLAQNRKTGSGKLTTENRAVASFNQIEANVVFTVILKQGAEESVQVETDDNLQELVLVSVENNILKLNMKKNVNFGHATKSNIYVHFKNLESFKNNMVGNLETEGTIQVNKLKYISNAVGNAKLNLAVTDLDLNIDAVGKTTITGKGANCNFTNAAVGNFEGDNFLVENMKLKNNAVGNTAVNAKNLELDNNGVGRITNKNGK